MVMLGQLTIHVSAMMISTFDWVLQFLYAAGYFTEQNLSMVMPKTV